MEQIGGDVMNITLQYFDGCPNWETTRAHLATLLGEGLDAAIDYELVDTYEMAVERGFGGSPTVLVDGVDAFADRRAVAGLACRVYDTEHGPAGSPTLDQLRAAIGSVRIPK
jgi:hypothetical protein